MKLQQSDYQALIVTKNGCVHSISTVVHDNNGSGMANSHGYTLHINYNDFIENGYAIDVNGNPNDEYVDIAFLNDGHIFDKIVEVLGKNVAIKVVYNVFQMTAIEQLMSNEAVKEQLLGIFNTIIRKTCLYIADKSHEKDNSILAHTNNFRYEM